jgi:hypothetical protein
LRDDGEAAAEVVELEGIDVNAVDDDASRGGLDESEERQAEGTLA